ncbi:DUF2254 domain-containing protein [Phytohabitans suffuscus]|uniref:DUF2254 domain-containing protein n=1 Tax=Phytohabitans suffuscus TaxID=624315 RepID=A0A6F8YAH5_9ACTN|nr:DUF2254 domain-containing protein [Phytohabitans suffuscus]BCB83106.1 hypothetical protein Psuf_004190 [Phytohabitans suffuscus]
MSDSTGTLRQYRDVSLLRLRALRDHLRESLLFLPALMLAGALVIGGFLDRLDGHFHPLVPQRLSFAPDVAGLLLSTIAGATITTAGVVFSLLVVSLQLASGQFSPRVLRGFWRDRFSHLLIGLLLSTFVFCVLALARVNTDKNIAPPYTVLFALLLTLASVIVIVVYLDRIIRQQYVGNIMRRVLNETLRLVAELPYGRHLGGRVGEPVRPPDPGTLGPSMVVTAPVDGWVQQISRRGVLAAVPDGTVVRLETRVGAYLTMHTPLATLWPPPPPDQRDRIGRLVTRSMIVATARSMQQDIDFGLRQLNDIALRALSDVNDPTTAVEAISRIGSLMRPLLLADLPARSVEDGAGRILLTPRDPDHATYVRHAFAQLHVYAAGHPQARETIADTIRMLQTACADLPGRQAARAELDHHLTITLPETPS